MNRTEKIVVASALATIVSVVTAASYLHGQMVAIAESDAKRFAESQDAQNQQLLLIRAEIIESRLRHN